MPGQKNRFVYQIISSDLSNRGQVFVLDQRTYPSKNVLHPGLRETQGAALLAYNNSQFMKEDWNAIRSIEESSKAKDFT
jgi:hypothetical protein